jgi:hypothetical protein
MKKSLVLAMAMALGVTASAYAANPFSDVPAGHWAYDSISKLAAAGVIEGYGDDTFRGDRLMTRYEMAQIVAKAMAKGANVDKLAAEFADELDALGVRVAALEKKADNVKITGAVRYHYAHLRGDSTGPDYNGTNHSHQLRTRLNFTGKVNDNWNYFGVLENRMKLDDNVGNELTRFTVASLNGRLGGLNVNAGRIYHTRDPFGDIYDKEFDGIEVSYGSKIKIGGYYGKPATTKWQDGTGKVCGGEGWTKSWGVNASAQLGKAVTLYAGYDEFKDNEDEARDDNGIFDVAATAKFGDFTIGASYLKSNSDTVENDKGFTATLSYGGANFKKPGSWGLEAKYYKLGDGINIMHTMNGDAWMFTETYKDATGGGFKGYKVAGYYTIAKNMRAGIEYYDLKGYSNSDVKARTLWSELQVRF